MAQSSLAAPSRSRFGACLKSVVHAALSLAATCLLASPSRAAAPVAALQIYFIDVEGGQSTLIVTPSRQVLLVDAGYAGEGGLQAARGDPAKARDPNRILAAMRDAGVDHIDYLWVTHFHRDHIGGIPELAALVPVRAFVDHGSAYPAEERSGPKPADALDVAAYDAYLPVRAAARHVQPKPGDRLPLKGVELTVVSADGATLKRPLKGAGSRNAACEAAPVIPATDGSHQNPRSNGFVLKLGRFRFLDLGDLSDAPLHALVCPTNRIGRVDAYLVAHHGGGDAADPATLAAFEPRVAVVNNGARKGGGAATLKLLRETRGIDSWQLHLADNGGEQAGPAERTANLDDSGAHWLKLTAEPSGAFRVTNGRTGVVQDYP